jgi:non-ribosomal peptide synthetase component E (peptide arylation enzyme)
MEIESLLTQEMIDEYRSQGYWGSMTLGDWLDYHAAFTPDNVALVDPRNTVTYGEFKLITDRIALKLLELGIRPKDRVGLQTPNWVEYFYMRFACAKMGAIVVPFIFNVREHELELALEEVEAVCFAFCTEFHNLDYIEMVERIRAKLPKLKHFICIGKRTGKGMLNLKEMISDVIERRHPPGYLFQHHPSANDIDILMSTSGSTARPKLVLRTPNIFISLGHHIVHRACMTSDEVVLAVAPVNQGTGYSVAVVASMIAGCKNILLERFNPEEALRLIEEEKVTMAVGVPAHMIKILNSPAFDSYNLETLRLFYHAGAPLPPEAAAEFSRRCGCQLMEAYGALDGGTPVHTILNDPPEKTFNTVGKTCPGMTLKIFDDQNQALPTGEVGEVVYKGPNCAVGLYDNPDHDYDEEGWFHSGDLGLLDEEGYLRIVGRKKDIIIRGGQNISPKEIEAALIVHPDIEEVSVVKMPDPVLGEKACAFIVSKSSKKIALKDLVDFLMDMNFAKYKLPERVESISDIPLLPNGKVNKKALEAQIAQKLREEGQMA